MNKIVEIAIGEIGIEEVPANSNLTKYGEWFGFDGVAWCGIFVSYCYYLAGYPLKHLGFKKGFAGCQTAMAYFKQHNMITTDPQPGDLVFFDWNNDGRFDHVGIFLSWNGNNFFDIEGNTSLTNQSNGGQVMKRDRNTKHATFVRVIY